MPRITSSTSWPRVVSTREKQPTAKSMLAAMIPASTLSSTVLTHLCARAVSHARYVMHVSAFEAITHPVITCISEDQVALQVSTLMRSEGHDGTRVTKRRRTTCCQPHAATMLLHAKAHGAHHACGTTCIYDSSSGTKIIDALQKSGDALRDASDVARRHHHARGAHHG